MAGVALSPSFSNNANIAIYLGSIDGQETAKSQETTQEAFPEHKISSRDQPVHCILDGSPSPPSHRSIVSPPTSPGRLALPNQATETSHNWSKPQPPRPALRLNPCGKQHLRYRRNAVSPISPQITREDGIDWSQKRNDGLAVSGAKHETDKSPITPGTLEKEGDERVENRPSPSNFAERIEKKLWRYDSSKSIVKRWMVEIISWTLSAVCMIGIIVMLVLYENKRIPQWSFGLTLNAYVSDLSKVASAALLLPVSEALGQLKWSWFKGSNSKKMWDFEIFDNASRGAWGSLLLLMRTKGRSLAALGAALTLFAIALDPFFQQLVKYPERWRLLESVGSLPKAISYEPYAAGMELRGDHFNLELDQNMLAVLYNYFYNRGTPPVKFGQGVRAEVPLGCPSSNCTWPEYETLGVCSECTDASDKLEFKCQNAALDWIQSPHENDNGTYYLNGTACGWWLKADIPILMTGYNVDNDTEWAGEILVMRGQPYYDISTREPLPGFRPELAVRDPLAHVIIASGRNYEKIKRNETPITNECIMSWCVKKMSSNYTAGGYFEDVIETYVNRTPSWQAWKAHKIWSTTGLVGTDYTYQRNITLYGESETPYLIDNQTHAYTASLFDDMFPSTYTIANSTDMKDAFLRYKWWTIFAPFKRNMTHNAYLYSNVSDHLDNLATALTNLLRSSTEIEQVPGKAFDKENFVDVHWPWLTLPLGLLTLTFIFLICTIIQSALEKEGVGIWKTSAMATLLYGLPDEMQNKMTSSKDEPDMPDTPRAKAKDMKVRWHPKNGWRLSGTSSITSRGSGDRHSFSPTVTPAKRSSSHSISPKPSISFNYSSSTLVNNSIEPPTPPPKSRTASTPTYHVSPATPPPSSQITPSPMSSSTQFTSIDRRASHSSSSRSSSTAPTGWL